MQGERGRKVGRKNEERKSDYSLFFHPYFFPRSTGPAPSRKRYALSVIIRLPMDGERESQKENEKVGRMKATIRGRLYAACLSFVSMGAHPEH